MRYLFSLLALVAVLAMAGSIQAKEAPTLVLDPSAGGGGTTVGYSGRGYTPGAEVTLVAGGDGVIVAIALADGEGNISGELDMISREDIPGVNGNEVSVFAIELDSGRESGRVAFFYDTSGSSGAGSPETVRVTFELAVGGETSGDTTYWALYGPPDSEAAARRLTDPDEDGAYSFSMEVPEGSSLVARVVQGTGTQDTEYGPFPGEPAHTLKDFGKLTLTEDLVLRTSAPEQTAQETPELKTARAEPDPSEATPMPTAPPATGGGGRRVWGTGQFLR